VTVDLHGAMCSFAKSRDAQWTHFPVDDHTAPMGDMPATGTSTSTSNGRSVATRRPSLITNRCYEEYM
jgi:hypothetical protein